jgi:penicillin-binding protein 2
LGRLGGFGEVTGIDVPGERAGVLPSDAWKRRVMKERWYPGDTINLAIGQGFTDVTPIQVAQFVMGVASGGDIRRMHVFDHAVDPETGEVIQRAEVETVRHIPWKPGTLAFLHDAMQGVVDQGTATRARIRGISIAGKTGTAQPSSGEAPKGMKREDRPERYQEHAWFAGFAPVETPEVAFAIVLEHVGLHGGEAAAPIAHDILTAWFQDRLLVAGQ